MMLENMLKEELNLQKIVLAAEDSGVARECSNRVFSKQTGVKYEIYANGTFTSTKS